MFRLLWLIITLLPAPLLAQTRSITDDIGRAVEVPSSPARIVSLHDLDLTIPLIELGVEPVGSHGRMGTDGKPYLRSSAALTGVDFANSSIAYVGSIAVDLEAILKLAPDLIVTGPDRPTPVEQLEKIAPTVVIDSADGAPHIYRRLAELTGTEARLVTLEARYAAQLETLRGVVDPGTVTVSVIQPLNGKISVYHSYRALGRVLRDAGFRFPPLIDEIPEGERVEVSAERLPELDADYIFDPYRTDDMGGAATDEIAAMEQVMPGFCDFLEACQAGRYVLVSREEAISNSYAALGMMVAAVRAEMTPRPGVAN